jgi:beta-glucosidase
VNQKNHYFLFLFLLSLSLAGISGLNNQRMRVLLFVLAVAHLSMGLQKTSFPDEFFFGTATAAYQVEGAYNVDGRGLSIWDVWSAKHSFDHETGNVADDEYFRLEEDIQLIASLNFTHYRFSISWSRVIPTGKIKDGVNPLGLAYYQRVFDLCEKYHIVPFVTLFHWDTPLTFFSGNQSAAVGWLRPEIVSDFVDYATLIFKTFPDQPYFLTFNEPLSFIKNGYTAPTQAPGRCGNRSVCMYGDAETEPYLAGHHVLLAHAQTVKVFREMNYKGQIGITLDITFAVPLDSDSEEDKQAADRSMLFQVGWWAFPIYFGTYPPVMKELLGARLPTFSPEESALIKGSHDFFGTNHYTSAYVSSGRSGQPQDGWSYDQNVTYSHEKNGVPIGPKAASDWLYIYPPGLRGAVNWITETFAPKSIYVTENGVDGEVGRPREEILNDQFRIQYYSDYLSELLKAITIDKIPVKGYMAWSIMDNFEWHDGYSKLFGICFIDRENNLTRTLKDSAKWWNSFNTGGN